MDNLDKFQEVMRELSSQGRNIAKDYFIGMLSAEVPPEIWADVIETLEKMIKEYKVE